MNVFFTIVIIVALIIVIYGALTSKPDNVKISVVELERLIKGAGDRKAAELVMDAIFNEQRFIYVSQETLDRIKGKANDQKLRNTGWSILYEMKQSGQGLEKSGLLPEAFAAFKELVSFASNSKTLTSKNYSLDINRLNRRSA